MARCVACDWMPLSCGHRYRIDTVEHQHDSRGAITSLAGLTSLLLRLELVYFRGPRAKARGYRDAAAPQPKRGSMRKLSATCDSLRGNPGFERALRGVLDWYYREFGVTNSNTEVLL